MTNETYKALVTEVFGPGYYELMQPLKKSIEQNERNIKLCLVKNIIESGRFMGIEPSGKLFDELMDLDIEKLYQEEIKTEDKKYIYARSKKMIA